MTKHKVLPVRNPFLTETRTLYEYYAHEKQRQSNQATQLDPDATKRVHFESDIYCYAAVRDKSSFCLKQNCPNKTNANTDARIKCFKDAIVILNDLELHAQDLPKGGTCRMLLVYFNFK